MYMNIHPVYAHIYTCYIGYICLSKYYKYKHLLKEKFRIMQIKKIKLFLRETRVWKNCVQLKKYPTIATTIPTRLGCGIEEESMELGKNIYEQAKNIFRRYFMKFCANNVC